MIEVKLTKQAELMQLYDSLLPETQGSAGIDLKACIQNPILLPAGSDEIVEIPTGLHFWFKSPRLACLLLPRGSSKYKLVNTIGLVDSDYQGEYILKVHNPWHDRDLYIKPGERIAQMVLFKVMNPTEIEYKFVNGFSELTERGSGRNGSTGK